MVRSIVIREGRPDVAGVSIISCRWRRKGGAESYVMLEQIDLLPGGTVGASSQAVDEGWRCSIVLP